MPFWGVEIKPGKPYSHKHNDLLGRLRISQATLGNGKSTNKCTVQCNVGNKSPILLCNLIPNVFETCHLDLEFEELQEVVFSVLGQRSIHLSGYYLGGSGRDLHGDDTDSYGEDIADTDASDSYGDSDDEDEYESDFIDDDDYEMFPGPPRQKSGVVIEEIIEDDKPSNGNVNHRRLKKKNQLSDSDDVGDDTREKGIMVKRNSSAVIESEDEDGFPISFSRKKNVVEDSAGNSNLKSDDKTVTEDLEKKIDTSKTNERCDTLPPSEFRQEKNDKSKKKKKKKAKDEKSIETSPKAPAEETTSVAPDQDKHDHKDNEVQVGEANVEAKTYGADGTDNEGKPCNTLVPSEFRQEKKDKSKKKTKAKDEKPFETSPKAPAEETTSVAPDQDKHDHKDNDVQVGEANVESKTPGADGTDNEGKPKKKKKKTKKGKITEAGADASVERTHDKSAEDASKDANNDKMDQDPPVTGELEIEPGQNEVVDPSVASATAQETNGKLKKKSKNKRAKDERGSDAEGGEVSDVKPTDAKKKKKESKNNDVVLAAPQELEQVESEVTKSGQKKRSFANGLVIEELAMGKPDGKRATKGKKVHVNYIGKLKDGTIFDSTVGKRPFSFRLGIGQVIKGWDVGVSGMRVGDKRRLTVPPSYGYGHKQTGPIPPNSWLTFDVELVSVN